MSAVLIVISGDYDPMTQALIDEFDRIMTALDVGAATPAEWAAFKATLALATLEAGDAEGGACGFAIALEKWRLCRAYDGED